MDSPSVFNFFPPDYNIPGTNLLGPEFDLETTATTLVRANFVNSFVYGSIGTGTTVSFTTYANLAANPNAIGPAARFAECAAAAQLHDFGCARQHSRGGECRSGGFHAEPSARRGRHLFDSFVVAIPGRTVGIEYEESYENHAKRS